MSYLFEIGVETGDVLRIGKDTISVEHNGDGPLWDKHGEPNYPWYSMREILSISESEIDRIGELVKKHLRERKRKLNNEFPKEIFVDVEQREVK